MKLIVIMTFNILLIVLIMFFMEEIMEFEEPMIFFGCGSIQGIILSFFLDKKINNAKQDT